MADIDYTAETYNELETLFRNRTFRYDLAQVRARAIQEELVPEAPRIDFRFDPQKVWKYCDFLFSEGSLLIRQYSTDQQAAQGDRARLMTLVRNAGIAFEFLARFSTDDTEILLINAAICCHIVGLHANAFCIARMVESQALISVNTNGSEATDIIVAHLFRRALLDFLKRDIVALRRNSERGLAFIQEVQQEVTLVIAEQRVPVSEVFSLTAHAFFHQCSRDFVQYCMYGDRQLLLNTFRNMQKVYRYFERAGEATFGTIASELRTVLALFDERSTWSVLARYAPELVENRVWQTYLRNLAFEKSIVEFWSSQLKAIESGLLTADDSFVVQMPTSAGKTFIAELSMVARLARGEGARCLYIAPFRALVNEVEQKLVETLGAVGFRVSNLIGGFEFDTLQDFLATESDVLVATPEKVDLFLRTHPEYFDSISVIIVDEGHILDEGILSSDDVRNGKDLFGELERNSTLGRGILLELLITRLKLKLPQARFVFLSAVMPEVNAGDFVAWLSENKQEPLRIISQAERPTRQTIGTFQWVNEGNGELEYSGLTQLPDGRYPFVPFFITKVKYYTGDTTSTGRKQQTTWPSNTKSKTQSAAMLACRFAKTGPVLVFCAQPSDVRNVVSNISTSLRYLEASDLLPTLSVRYVETPNLESYHLAMEWLGEGHPLTQSLRRGVGLHYGPLPDPVRQAVENDFRNGNIRILVCTNTLGQGVNMPVKTAIIYSLERRYPDETSPNSMRFEKMKRRDFWNICGRAGRAGKETEGQIIFVLSSDRDAQLFQEYRNSDNIEEIESALYKLLQALVEKRISQDQLIGYLDSHLLAVLGEEIVNTEDEESFRKLVGASLVGVQASRHNIDIAPLISAMQNTSRWIATAVPDRVLQKVFSTTGLRVDSCKTLEQQVDAFLRAFDQTTLDSERNRITVNEELLRAAFAGCSSLPETRLKDSIAGPIDEFAMLKDWVAGVPVREIRTSHWSEGEDEDFSEYLADRVIYKMSWGVNGFLRILAHKMGLPFDELPLTWQHLPFMVKYGIDNVVACWAGSLGIHSRGMMVELARLYTREEGASFINFLHWVAELPTEFIFRELRGSEFDKQRLISITASLTLDDQHLRFTRQQTRLIEAQIQGIPYEGRHLLAAEVRNGDSVILQLEPENLYDKNAIKVLYNGQQIGYIPRDKARIIAQEIRVGRVFQVSVTHIEQPTPTYSFHQIGITIQERE